MGEGREKDEMVAPLMREQAAAGVLPWLSLQSLTQQRTHRDGLPENTAYRDDGCDLHDHCLSCPLPACRYEMGPGRVKSLSRMAALRVALAAGRTMDQAAAVVGISRRSAYRLWKQAREGVV